MRFDIISIFPEMFASVFAESLIQRAREQGILEIHCHNLRDYTLDKHRKVDDYPFGGGVGVIMNIEPIVRAIEAVKIHNPQGQVILMSPAGERFGQKKAWELARRPGLILVCGRYEGVDARIEHFVDEQISIGDYILSGGEIPAMAVVDAVSRLTPGVVGDHRSVIEESFDENLLEHPQYTHPRDFRGHKVPEVLLSGHHRKIQEWQEEQARARTARQRPDLSAAPPREP